MQKETIVSKHLLKKEIVREIKTRTEKKGEGKKEMNPKLSRALWLLIPGGLATLLGILLYGVAPTGLFIFVFSLVF